jgi:hypothetical protein
MNKKKEFNPLQPNGKYVPVALRISKAAFHIYEYCIIVTVNSNYFLEGR